MDTTRLLRTLQLRRQHNSIGEATFIFQELEDYIQSEHTLKDPTGFTLAYVHRVGDSRTMFSCHIDTVVHGKDSGETFNQVGVVDGENAYYAMDNTLGADDGAGVWLLMEMIDAGVPGTYVFHRGEECGGLGSSGIRDHHEDWLRQFDRAIAFDRRGTTSVITHQGSLRCCSDDFAKALAAQLVMEKYTLAPDDGGTFTDTKHYTGAIAECTNVSIGYQSEHTNKEWLDLDYLYALRDACVAADWENLPTKRIPGTREYLSYGGWTGRKGHYSYGMWDDDWPYAAGYSTPAKAEANVEHMTMTELEDHVSRMAFTEIEDFCAEHPTEAAMLLDDLLYERTYKAELDEAQKRLDVGL